MSNETANPNMVIWDKFSKTDPTKTKNTTVSGQNRTCVDAQYKKMQITKAFGLYGLGWGVVPNSEIYERASFEGGTNLLHYRATAFFVHNGERGEFPIAASIKESYFTKNGQGYLKIDDEAVKKVRTDALTKGFTDLGFNADIHMGMFDDQDYVFGANAVAQMEKEEAQEAAIEKAISELAKYAKEEISAIQKVQNIAAFNAAMTKLKHKIDVRCRAANINPTNYIARIDQVMTERNGAQQHAS